MSDRLDEAKGNIKSGIGGATGNEKMEAEGKGEAGMAKAGREAKGAAREAAGNVKEGFGKLVGDKSTEVGGKTDRAKGKAERAG